MTRQWVFLVSGFQSDGFFHSLWRRGYLVKWQKGCNLQLGWQGLNCAPTTYMLCHLVQVKQHPQVCFFIEKIGLIKIAPRRLRNIKQNNESKDFCMVLASCILQKCKMFCHCPFLIWEKWRKESRKCVLWVGRHSRIIRGWGWNPEN